MKKATNIKKDQKAEKDQSQEVVIKNIQKILFNLMSTKVIY